MLTGFIYWVKVRFFIVVVAACFQVIAGGFVNNLGLYNFFRSFWLKTRKPCQNRPLTKHALQW